MKLTTYIDYHDRPTWLAARPGFIGASESAALLGYGYAGQNAASVFADKVAPQQSDDDGTDAMTVGRLLEPGLANVFEHFSGLPCELEVPFRVHRHPDAPFIGATIDAWTVSDGHEKPVELKNVDNFLMRQWSDENVAPLKCQIQVSHQLLVTRAPNGYLSGLIGGNKPVIREIPRNEDFIANLKAKLVEFWGFVQRKELPVDWFEWSADATSDAIKRLHPMDNGESVMLSADADEWSDRLAAAKAIKKEAEAAEKKYGNLLRAGIGDATFGMTFSGKQWSWRSQTNHYAAKEATETTFRVLRLAR